MNKLSQEQLEAIRKRAEAATEGYWLSTGVHISGGNIIRGTMTIAECERVEDAKFIAHSRTDVPKLLEEVERLRVKESEYRQLLVDIRHEVLDCGSDLDYRVFKVLYGKERVYEKA